MNSSAIAVFVVTAVLTTSAFAGEASKAAKREGSATKYLELRKEKNPNCAPSGQGGRIDRVYNKHATKDILFDVETREKSTSAQDVRVKPSERTSLGCTASDGRSWERKIVNARFAE